jgi:hypothetical protein
MPHHDLHEDIPGNRPPPPPLDLLPYVPRVAKLIHSNAALEHWRQRCHESYRERCERLGERDTWKKRRESHVLSAWMRQQDEEAILKWVNEGNPWCAAELGEAELWTTEGVTVSMPDGNQKRVGILIPPDLEIGKEPYAEGPIPFSRCLRLSMADCFSVLALIHDSGRSDGKRIIPFDLDEWNGETNFWYVRSGEVAKFCSRDQATIEDCFACVEADLRDRDFSSEKSRQLGGDDESVYRPMKEFVKEPFDTFAKVTSILKKNPWIRTLKPNPRRLKIHAGDWQKFLNEGATSPVDPLDMPAEMVDEAVREVEERKAKVRGSKPKK